MDVDLTRDHLEFRDEVRTWLEEHLIGDFGDLRGRGGTSQEDIPVDVLVAWEQELASGGWLGLDFPHKFGGRACSLAEQVVFHMTYAESRAPGRLPNMGVTLLAPTLLAFGSPEQCERFIPQILAGDEFWCQGYGEPDAGSDLANVKTRAWRDGDEWVIEGQKVWTSLAQCAQWAFVVCRTEEGSQRHRGLSYLLVPMDQTGVEIRPIVQLTGGSEFNETFFNEARTAEDWVVGDVGDGWRVAMGTLGFERGASTLGQQLSFRQEFDELLAAAKANGAAVEPVLRQRLVDAWAMLEIMRFNNLRMLSTIAKGASESGGVPGPEMSIGKLYWSNWHRALGELMVDVQGAAAMVVDDVTRDGHGPADAYPLGRTQRTFLYSRAHTIYAGSNEVQRNVIGERVLGLPREPRA